MPSELTYFGLFVILSIFFSVVSVLEVVADTILVCINLSHHKNKKDTSQPQRINKLFKKLVNDFNKIKEKKKNEKKEKKESDEED